MLAAFTEGRYYVHHKERRMGKLGIAVLSLALAACGSKDSKTDDDSTAPKAVVAGDATTVPVTPVVAVGVEHPKAFNFGYGKAAKAFKPVAKAVKASDWPAVKTACQATLELSPQHRDAQISLARALAELSDTAELAGPLLEALAADYTGYAPELETTALAKHLVQDAELRGKVEAIKQAYLDRAKGGLMVVARRSKYRAPRTHKRKVQWAATRAELYAYDRETERYLRLTHTKHSVAGWLISPSGDELSFVAHAGVKTAGAQDQPSLLGWVKIGVINMDTLQASTKLISVKGTPRRVRLGYRGGDELLVETSAGEGRWGIVDRKVWVVDRGAGKLKKSKLEFDPVRALVVDVDRVGLERGAVAEIQADAEATSFRLLPTNTTVTMPAGEVVAGGGYVWSPDKVHLVVRTMARPCEKSGEASLYLVDAATGALKNILRGASTFETRWIDNDHFVYEDDEGALRIYDVDERTQVGRIAESGGIALVGLAAGRGPLCTEPQVADDAAPEGAPTGVEAEDDSGTPPGTPVDPATEVP